MLYEFYVLYMNTFTIITVTPLDKETTAVIEETIKENPPKKLELKNYTTGELDMYGALKRSIRGPKRPLSIARAKAKAKAKQKIEFHTRGLGDFRDLLMIYLGLVLLLLLLFFGIL